MSNPPPASVRDIFRDADQRDVANHLGMWAFLATEILFFGGLFVSYIIYRWAYPAAFAIGSQHLEFWIGTVNTAVLLTSSLSMAMGDAYIKAGNRKALRICLLVTFLFGLVFLGLKGVEYAGKFRAHEVPGPGFRMDGPPQVELFLFLYFAMTGLHALHMIVGLGLMAWLIRSNEKGRFTSHHHAPVAMVGLYWHFVDCVWVFLYPLLYLIR